MTDRNKNFTAKGLDSAIRRIVDEQIELIDNTGPQGPEGPEGPQGPEGPEGPQGPAGTDADGDISSSSDLTSSRIPRATNSKEINTDVDIKLSYQTINSLDDTIDIFADSGKILRIRTTDKDILIVAGTGTVYVDGFEIALLPNIDTDLLPEATESMSGYPAYPGSLSGQMVDSWSIVSGSLPSGLSLDGSTGDITGDLSSSAGNFPFTVRGTGPGGYRDVDMSIDVAEIPIVVDDLMPNGEAGAPYFFSFGVTGGAQRDGYSGTFLMDLTPSGMTLETDGSFFGSPDIADNYEMSVTFTDINGVTSAPTLFSWTVT